MMSNIVLIIANGDCTMEVTEGRLSFSQTFHSSEVLAARSAFNWSNRYAAVKRFSTSAIEQVWARYDMVLHFEATEC